MDAVAFARIEESFRQFQHFFGSAFGRQQGREHSRHYLQALLVQARALQRFLTDARWDDERVIGRLQHPQAVWVLDGRDFPKQGRKSVGVARPYCGILGKIANCQAGLCLAHVGPRMRPSACRPPAGPVWRRPACGTSWM